MLSSFELFYFWGIITGVSPRLKDTVNKFGKVIARLLNEKRLQKSVTQAELAEATGISQSQISKQLRGTRDINIDELGAMATALDMSLVELIRQAQREINPATCANKIDDLTARRAGTPVPHPSDSMPLNADAYSCPDEDAERNDADDD